MIYIMNKHIFNKLMEENKSNLNEVLDEKVQEVTQSAETTKDEFEKLNKFINDNVQCLKSKDLETSDDESEDTEHYFNFIANPNKIISKDVENNRLYDQTLEIKLEKQKLETQYNFVNSALNFMKIEFSMEGIELDPTNENSIKTFKNRMLDKVIEFSKVKKSYIKLINCEDIDALLKNYFIPLVELKYLHFYSIYSLTKNNNSKQNVLLIIVSVLVLLSAVSYFF